jgi:hypothetical protein
MNSIIATMPWVAGALLCGAFVVVGVGRLRRSLRPPRANSGSPLVLTPRFSPVGTDFEGSDERWIELAAEVCCQHNHRLGIIALQILDAEGANCSPSSETVADFNAALTSAFSASLRPSDLISVRDRGEIVIGVAFILNKDQITRIIDRLRPIVERVAKDLGMSVRCNFGASIYPIDGYSGGELIQSALHDAEKEPTTPTQEILPARPRVMIGAR